ncbi:MSMEG_0565 family glycosyltransferase [Nocardioidaceae bacterium]|nr:MSMEG_0565 family glycosyltransferase [Nocardioidaceae bacterium]
MRIALLTYSTRPRGGVVHTLHLAEALTRLGHEVHVWTLGRGGDAGFFRPVDPGVTVHAVPFPEVDGEDVGARIVRSIQVLGQALAPLVPTYGVVHAQDCISANAALAADVPDLVRTVHHLDSFTTPELVACHDRAVREPARLLCVSAAVAGEVESAYDRTPPVIPNGVAADRFRAAADDFVRRAAWRERLGRYVLAVGGIEPRKGSLDLLESVALLRDGRPDLASVRLVYAGGETLFDYRDYRAAFEARAVELAIEPVVLGAVPDDDLPSLMAEAAALPFLSVKEGFGLAALEALAAGTPVVARDLPVLREVLGDTVAFGSTPPQFAAALATAVDRPPHPGNGRALAASYTWDRAARSHVDLYTGPTGRGSSD